MTFRSIQRLALFAAGVMVWTACSDGRSVKLTPELRAAISDSVRQLVVGTYDLDGPNVVDRLMSLYPDSGAVYSTSSGQVSTTRTELRRQIETFWEYVGSNMREPKWEWTSMVIDVLSPDAAAVTAAYRIPHLTPQNTPHVIAGAWTAIFVKREGTWVVIQEHLSDAPAAAAAAASGEDHTGH